jgi:L-asparagine transporter-like permease
MKMRAATIWLCLAFLWLIDAGFALRRHDHRQALVAGVVAAGFLGAGFYLSARSGRRR